MKLSLICVWRNFSEVLCLFN